jgi:DNA mismatch repair protein MutL
MQYFFVNGRYMRHAYFHRAVMTAFEPFIPAGDQPNYFIYMEVDPAGIDVNIHPTKTEIKFEDERMLFQVMVSAVKEAIAVPALEFDREGAIDVPIYTEHREPVTPPKVQMRSDYNPFKETHSYQRPPLNWEQLYDTTGNRQPATGESESIPFSQPETGEPKSVLQFKGRYLITSLKSGLTLIDQRRAHIRILFDDYMRRMAQQQGISQKLIFPEIVSFTSKEATILPCILDDLAFIGFDLANLGGNSYSINGIPSGLDNVEPATTLQDMVDKALETGCEIQEEIMESLALALAHKAAMPYGKNLPEEEAQSLIARLFSTTSPNYTPDGKVIVSIVSEEELSKRFV